jgi:hypothetical protein
LPLIGAQGQLVEFFAYAPRDLNSDFELGEQCAPAVLLCNFVDRATHVDVDDRRAVLCGPASALRHDVRLAPIELHAHGFVKGVGLCKVKARRSPAQKSLRAQKIGARESHASPFTADGAKRKIAVPRDWREEQIA